ncbi:uncharacterized protein K02A2.6-like [Mytilus trossulus]|uniref:uncharacterized protein K02A2.6-like n=1 Tax=Mytilus trossulus TaxID=6551 RepID=UPI00300533B0
MAASLPNFPSFPVHENNAEIRWRKWISRLENLFIGLNIKDSKRQRALLLHYAGEDVNEVFDTLDNTGEDVDAAKQKLTAYFAPKKNTEYEIYKFRQAKQTSDETIDSFHTRLRQLAVNCEFTETSKEVKSQIIQGCHSTRLRRKALREDTTLEGLISSARALELSEKQASEIEQSDKQSANAVRKGVGKRRNGPRFLQTQTDQNVKKRTTGTCRNCGGDFPHANKKYCDKVQKGQPKINVKINNSNVDILIDTGSSINVIDESTFENIKCKPKLSHADTKVFAYGSDKNLKLMGKFHATIETDHKIKTAPVYAMKGRYGNLLCYDTSVDLSIVPVISAVADKHEILCNKYSDVFNGIGKLKDEKVEIHIDGSIRPVIQPHRRIPFHIRKQVEAELEKLEKQDIIEKVDGPTPWVSPIVLAHKPKNKNEIRLCVDMREPNKAILRSRHITPTLDDMILDLNGSKVFSKMDLRSGYHQLELNEESRNITTFTTHVGLRRYKRLSFSVSSAAELTKQDSKWEWTSEQQESFDKLKNELVADRVMSYFDPNKETMLIVDASPVGLAGLLIQNGKIIAYASRSLTDVETRYSQTEKEALAIYKPGKVNAADYLSRHPTPNTSIACKHSQLAEEYVRYLTDNAVPKAMTLNEIAESTQKDKDLQTVITALKSNRWDKYESNTLDTFSRLRYELTIVPVNDMEIILHDNRIVIPKELQMRVIDLAHEGHQGIVRTKQLLREKVYFPGIDKLVEQTCKSCIPCLASTPKNVFEPLQMSEIPNNVWENLSMDFCGPFPNGYYVMVIIDEYSRYPVIETLTSLTAKSVIPLLDKTFSIFGIPKERKTDNGPPFNSGEFRNFADNMGFKHRKITPLWPRANAESERFMRTIGKAIRAAQTEHRSWKQEIHTFLRNYRATPHSTTNVSPAELLFGRKINTKMQNSSINNQADSEVRKEDHKNKIKMKSYFEKKHSVKVPDFTVGDTVLVKQEKKDKLSTPYNPQPLTIKNKKGSMITATNEQQKDITRNSSHFKKVGKSNIMTDEEIEEIIDDDIPNTPLRRSSRAKQTSKHLDDYVR